MVLRQKGEDIINPNKRRYIEYNYKFNTGDIIVKFKNNGIEDYVVGYRKILDYNFCYLGGMDKYKTIEVIPADGEFKAIGTIKLNNKEDIELLYKLKE